MTTETRMKLVFGGAIALFAGILADISFSSTRLASGTVVGRSYTEAASQTGVGTTVSANGGTTPVVTVSTTPERWIVIVRIDGEVVPADATPERWAELKDGDEVSVALHVGWISGATFGRAVR